MENGMSRASRHAGTAAALLFAGAVPGFGAALPRYLQSQHPVALLGAMGIPHALAFNLIGFVLPGLLAGVVAIALRRGLPDDAAWPSRIGAQLVLLSALGFIAMGVLPLDPSDLDSESNRAHATAWMLWCMAFVPGAALLGVSLWGQRAWKKFARISLFSAVGVLISAFALGELVPVGIAQRFAFGFWFFWLIVAGKSRAG